MKTETRPNTRLLGLLALFCALSAVGAQLRLYGSVALDALPAFLAAFLLGGPAGAVVGAVGHLLTAGLAALPLSLPLHLVVAAEMAGVCWCAGALAKKRPLWLAAVAAFVLNAFVSPLILLFWPGMGLPVMLMLLPGLVAGSAVNAFGAAAVAALLQKRLPAVRGWRG